MAGMGSANERETLAAEFDRHVAEEDEILKEYRTLSDKLTEGPLRVLVDHIVTEEEMHHFLLRTLSDWLRTPPAPSRSLTDHGLDRDAIMRYTTALQDHETKTIEACRSLRSRLSSDEGEIFEALLDAIALDSEKHYRLLTTLGKMISR
jgi:hypothetical protein